MQSLLGDILRGFGAKDVIAVRNTDAAWAELEGRAVDLMLVDWMVGPLDGRAFIREVRKSRSERLRLVPVIMITGHSERYRVEQARDAGANEFLTLPLAPMTLFDRIVSLIDQPRPFVRTRTYFGPDRRRRRNPAYTGPWRRSGDSGYDPAKAAEDADPASAAPAAPDHAEMPS